MAGQWPEGPQRYLHPQPDRHCLYQFCKKRGDEPLFPIVASTARWRPRQRISSGIENWIAAHRKSGRRYLSFLVWLPAFAITVMDTTANYKSCFLHIPASNQANCTRRLQALRSKSKCQMRREILRNECIRQVFISHMFDSFWIPHKTR